MPIMYMSGMHRALEHSPETMNFKVSNVITDSNWNYSAITVQRLRSGTGARLPGFTSLFYG